MKRMLTVVALMALLSGAASAHQGMLALYADPAGGSCNADIGACQPVSMYLVYVRGGGPNIAGGMGFRLSISTNDAAFMDPQWPGDHVSFGSLTEGIDIVVRCGEDWCLGDGEMAYMGTIPVVNFSDPDTFVVQVKENPYYSSIVVTRCELAYPLHPVQGGAFVFNGTCQSPEDPFGEHVAVENVTWGSIKGLFR